DFRSKGKAQAPYEKMREVADEVAQAVAKAHQGVKFQDWVSLAAARKELVLAVRKPNEEQLAYARGVLAKPDSEKPYHPLEKNYANRVLQLHESPDEVSVPLQAFRIG